MNYVCSTLGACLLLGTAAMPAMAQNQDSQSSPTGIQATQTMSGRATVQNIDHEDRAVTLKGENGNVFTVQVGEDVRNFNQVKKGDQVKFRSEESLALAVDKTSEPPSASEQEMLMRAQPGQLPGGAVIQTTRVSATVENIDRNTREVTLRLPQGQTQRVKLPKKSDALERLQKGDQVIATLTQAVAIEVTQPAR